MSPYGLIFWAVPLLILLVIFFIRSSSHKLQGQIREVLDARSMVKFEEAFKGLLLKITPVSGKQLRTFTIKQPVPEIPGSFQECRNVFHFHLIPSFKERQMTARSVVPIQVAGFSVVIVLLFVRFIINGYYFSAANFLSACIVCLICLKSLFKVVRESNEQEDELLKQVDERATAFLTEA